MIRVTRKMQALVVAGVAVAWMGTAGAQTPEQECLSKRAKAQGKYEYCVQKWLAKYYGGEPPDQAKLSKCREKYAKTWPKLQELTGTTCDVARFVDNGDGTVTDNLTGLVWEQKTNMDMIVDWPNPHDADNPYYWSEDGTKADGDVWFFFVSPYINGLNWISLPFTDNMNWRLPTFAELQTILLPEAYPCLSSPCISAGFGATKSGSYWSATTYAVINSSQAWIVDFSDGSVYPNAETGFSFVRAVRSGL